MRLTEDILIFVMCFSFGLFIVGNLNIGGTQLQAMQFFPQLLSWAFGLGLLAIGVIVVALSASGAGFGAVGNRIGEAVAITLFASIYGILVGYVTNVFTMLPAIGAWIATAFGVFCIVVFLLDVIERVTVNTRSSK